MSKYVVQISWQGIAHLSEDAQQSLYEAIPPYQRDARSKGRPQLGSGAIFPVPESDVVVNPFALPDSWPRAYGLDVGTKTAATWGATDPNSSIFYLYAEYFREGAEPSIHAMNIKSKGAWIPGVIDPAARGRSQIDGRRLSDMYKDLGLDLALANNAVEAGLLEMWEAMVAGRFKIFSSCQMWLREFRLYRRDEKGRIVKKLDHCLDSSRYLYMSGRDRAKAGRSKHPSQERAMAYSRAGVFGSGDRGGMWMS